jgi:Glycosyl transferase family 2
MRPAGKRSGAVSGRVTVIIPYYQEEPGILRGAVESALPQEGVSDLEIIVVDGGSPAPARDDLQGLDLPPHVTLKLIEQPNRGPGAARNRALDSVSSDTPYVAFLDSDDSWTMNHPRNAQGSCVTSEGVQRRPSQYRSFFFCDRCFTQSACRPGRSQACHALAIVPQARQSLSSREKLCGVIGRSRPRATITASSIAWR